METKKYHFFFSNQQRDIKTYLRIDDYNRQAPLTFRKSFARLGDGTVVEYTEKKEYVEDKEKPHSYFEDAVYLGVGVHNHSTATTQP